MGCSAVRQLRVPHLPPHTHHFFSSLCSVDKRLLHQGLDLLSGLEAALNSGTLFLYAPLSREVNEAEGATKATPVHMHVSNSSPPLLPRHANAHSL